MDAWELPIEELPSHTGIVVVGAGPAGLAAARELRRLHGAVQVLVLEAGHAVGGRVVTRERDGFRLDRGFQVLNTAYPEVREQLDADALELAPFVAGAAVRRDGEFHVVADPLRHPGRVGDTLRSPIGSLREKLQAARLAFAQRSLGPHVSDGPDQTAAQLLRDAGTGSFGELMLAPFFRGVLLEPGLASSARKLRWLLKVFGAGDSALPRLGMGEVTRQLASRLPDRSVVLGARVTRLTRSGEGAGTAAWRLELDGGAVLHADVVIVATEQAAAAELLAEAAPGAVASPGADVVPTGITHYYALPKPPADRRPMLLLGTGDDGPITNACMLSNVHASYAPEGCGLLQATVVPTASTVRDADALEQQVRAQLRTWFGGTVDTWRHLQTDWLEACLPFAEPGAYGRPRDARVDAGLLICGDHVDGGTLDGALRSGRVAAGAAARELSPVGAPASSR